jgi:urea carboxylase-associated protein 2
VKTCLYTYTVPGGSHWSLRLRRGLCLKLTDLEGDANLGMLFYNPEDLLERYNAPDTLKCQHTFKLTAGHCLYSDMGRIFCSIIQDDLGWHETVCGNSHADTVAQRWGMRDYQTDRNQWHQNGNDSFLVELAKYGLNGRDMAANVNWFSKVAADEKGDMHLVANHSKPGNSVTLRFEMDTLVIMHTCPHPLNRSESYPRKSVKVEIFVADPVAEDDFCKNSCEENQRGFANNHLYYLGQEVRA